MQQAILARAHRKSIGRHGELRGLESSGRSDQLEGRFGRMFRTLPPAHFDAGMLHDLAAAMTAEFEATPTPETEADDEENTGISAGYTYLGQFIDHDITFDPVSTLQKQDDPDALTDFRSPALDLDNVYGRGPDDQPYLYAGDGSFLRGDPLTLGDPDATDLIRNNASPRRALIGDPRNDENAIVSQLQGLFHRFHNRTLKDNPKAKFEDVQKLVRFHYQYVILNDFLPRIIHSGVIADLKTQGKYDKGKIKFFHIKHRPFMPVEFSVAAYRLGHSMIRPDYRLNDAVLLPIFPVPEATAPGF